MSASGQKRKSQATKQPMQRAPSATLELASPPPPIHQSSDQSTLSQQEKRDAKKAKRPMQHKKTAAEKAAEEADLDATMAIIDAASSTRKKRGPKPGFDPRRLHAAATATYKGDEAWNEFCEPLLTQKTRKGKPVMTQELRDHMPLTQRVAWMAGELTGQQKQAARAGASRTADNAAARLKLHAEDPSKLTTQDTTLLKQGNKHMKHASTAASQARCHDNARVRKAELVNQFDDVHMQGCIIDGCPLGGVTAAATCTCGVEPAHEHRPLKPGLPTRVSCLLEYAHKQPYCPCPKAFPRMRGGADVCSHVSGSCEQEPACDPPCDHSLCKLGNVSVIYSQPERLIEYMKTDVKCLWHHHLETVQQECWGTASLSADEKTWEQLKRRGCMHPLHDTMEYAPLVPTAAQLQASDAADSSSSSAAAAPSAANKPNSHLSFFHRSELFRGIAAKRYSLRHAQKARKHLADFEAGDAVVHCQFCHWLWTLCENSKLRTSESHVSQHILQQLLATPTGRAFFADFEKTTCVASDAERTDPDDRRWTPERWAAETAKLNAAAAEAQKKAHAARRAAAADAEAGGGSATDSE